MILTCHQVYCKHDSSGFYKGSGILTGSLGSLVADMGSPGNEQGLHKPQQAVP